MSYSPNFTGRSTDALAIRAGYSALNNSGLVINKASAVRLDVNGEYGEIDVAVETEALSAIGVTVDDIPVGETGESLMSGTIPDVNITANVGDIIYIAKTGELSNIRPQLGVNGFVAGDFAIKIGILFQNDVAPLQKDLFLSIAIIGQL